MSNTDQNGEGLNHSTGIISDKDYFSLIQSVIHQISDAVLMTTNDKSKSIKIVYANQSFFDMTGYESQEIHGRSPLLFLIPVQKEYAFNEIEAAFMSSEYYEKKLLLKRKNGGSYWGKLALNTFQKEIDDSLYQIHICRELTYEMLLTESQQKYKSLFDNHPDCVFALDLHGKFTSVNKACELLTGYSKGELLQLSLKSLLQEKDLGHAQRSFEKALGGITNSIETAIKSKTGKINNVCITKVPIYVDNEIRGIYGITQNITQTKYLTKILNIEKKVLEDIVGGKDFESTLSLFLLEIEGLFPSLMLSIMLANSKETHLDFFVGSSLPIPFSKNLKGVPIENGAGACGTSAFLEKPVIVPDVLENHLMKDYQDLAKTYDIKSCWSYPIFSSKGTLFGTFAIYRTIGGFPHKEVEKIMERAGNIISILIENKKSELAYKQLNERLKLAMDASHEAIWDWDVRNNILLWGSGFEIIFGYPLEEIDVTIEWWSINLHPDDKERVMASLDLALSSKASYWSNEYRYKAADGEYRFVLDRGHIIRDKNLKVVRMVGAMMDLTERKAAEEIMLESEAQFRSLADSTFEGIAISRDSIILDSNKAFAKMLQYDREDFVGKSILDFVTKDNFEKIESCLSLGKEEFCEVTGIRKDGMMFPAEIRGVNSTYKGKTSRTVSFRDISERKKTEKELTNFAAELSRSNAELEQFAYMASHDLQEPLRMVSSFLTLLKDRYHGKLDDTADQYISFALDGAERMKTLIKDLLKYSKISFQEVEVETIDLNELLQEIKLVFADILEETNGTLEIQDMPVVVGQKLLLLQLFQNLIGNGIKYRRKEPPKIKVLVKDQGPYWEFIVADNGIGIAEKFQEKIFVIFQRLHSRDEFSGTGIGLAICKKIVEKYGGRIWVTSIPEKGSEFHFTFPKK